MKHISIRINNQMNREVTEYIKKNNYRNLSSLVKETVLEKINSDFTDLTMSPFQEEISQKLLEVFSEINERATRMLDQMDTDYLIVREDENIYE